MSPKIHSDIAQACLLSRARLTGVQLSLAALIALRFAGAASAQVMQPYPPLLQPLAIEQVPGAPVYYTLGNPGVPVHDNEGNTSNAGFVITSDGVVVFDALGTPSLGWNLLQEIREVTDRKLRYVVLSHYHADHIYGLQAFR